MGDRNITNIDLNYIEIDQQISKALNLSRGCLFILSIDRDGKLLEFVYPSNLQGNMVPVNQRSILGRAVISRRYYISNNAKKEKDSMVLNSLISMGLTPVQKVITYPIEVGNKIKAVLEIVRRGDSLTESPDFEHEDIKTIRAVLAGIISQDVVEIA